jgi:superfamily II DNA or RNA helicase
VAEALQVTFTLRDNQVRTVRAVHERFRQGCRKVLAVAPTGFGKRICAVWWCNQAQQQGRCVLFVTNRRLLVEQMFRQTDAFGVSYGVIMAGTDAVDPGATVQIASLQTLRSRYFKDRWGTPTPERMPPADLLLIDECHQDVDGYEELFALYPDAKKILFTATPVDGDGKLLKADALVEEVRNTELIADGFLLPTRVFEACVQMDLKVGVDRIRSAGIIWVLSKCCSFIELREPEGVKPFRLFFCEMLFTPFTKFVCLHYPVMHLESDGGVNSL